MIKHCIKLIFFLVLLVVTGCSSVTEPIKVVLGTSTKALEDARVEAISQSYECGYRKCFDAILALGRKQEGQPVNDKYFEIFQKNREKGFLVVMGIEGQVDTTEVGIFLTKDARMKTSIDVSSLSSSAKRKVAKAVFAELDEHFIIINE